MNYAPSVSAVVARNVYISPGSITIVPVFAALKNDMIYS